MKEVKMGKSPCCDKKRVKRGAWSPEEDAKLIQHIKENGHGRWRDLPDQAGLLRCGKSCRLRWKNYLRPDIKRGPFTPEEEDTIIQLHGLIGNKWVAIASYLPGRTDNEIKNLWNTRLRKRLMSQNEQSSSKQSIIKSESPSTRHMVQWESIRVQAEARLSMEPLLHNSSLEDKTDSGDIFLRLWNSQVGESFRKSTRKGGVCANAISHSSLEEMDSDLFITSADNVMPGSDSISSNELTDSSELLLDFPGGYDMEMELLCQQTDNFSNFPDLQCN